MRVWCTRFCLIVLTQCVDAGWNVSARAFVRLCVVVAWVFVAAADYLLDDKLDADKTDLADHASLQTFSDYLCER